MTEAEKLAQRLDKLPFESEAAALIRSQEAKINRLIGSVQDAMSYMQVSDPRAYEILSERHADALRDAGVSE